MSDVIARPCLTGKASAEPLADHRLRYHPAAFESDLTLPCKTLATPKDLRDHLDALYRTTPLSALLALDRAHRCLPPTAVRPSPILALHAQAAPRSRSTSIRILQVARHVHLLQQNREFARDPARHHEWQPRALVPAWEPAEAAILVGQYDTRQPCRILRLRENRHMCRSMSCPRATSAGARPYCPIY